jgi:hypothetical protein
MSDHPGPSLNRWLELSVPPEDLAEVAQWLAELVDRREGRIPPGAARQYPVTEKLRAYAALARRGAAEHAAARARASAGASVPPVPVVSPAIGVAESGAEITTSEAARLAGLSGVRWRQLAASGRVRARMGARRAWLLDRADVIAYTSGKDTDGAHGNAGAAQPSAGSGSAA